MSRLPIVVLTIISLAAFLSALSSTFAPVQADETFMGWYGKLVAEGKAPYADFFTFLPPLVLAIPGLLAAIFGPGLVPLRAAVVILGTVSALFLYLLVRRAGHSRPAAAMAASWLPLLILPFQPLASHHWFSLTAILGVGVVVTSGEMGPRNGFILGALVAACGLMHQAAGLLAAILGGIALMRRRDAWRPAAFGLLSVILPIIAWLTMHGALDDAVRDILIWPFAHYHTAGGFNDIGVAETFFMLPTALSVVVPFGDAVAAGLILLLWAAAGLAVVQGLGHRAPGEEAWSGARASAGLLILGLLLFTRSRPDLIHLALWTPLALVVLLRAPAPAAPVRRGVRLLITAGVCVGVARFASLWASAWPAWDLAGTDRLMEARLESEVLSHIPGARRDSAEIVYVSHAGSMLYLYWSPGSPPLDWLLPASMGNNRGTDYRLLADYLRERAVPHVIVSHRTSTRFLTEETALRDALLRDYEPVGAVAWGKLFRRVNRKMAMPGATSAATALRIGTKASDGPWVREP